MYSRHIVYPVKYTAIKKSKDFKRSNLNNSSYYPRVPPQFPATAGRAHTLRRVCSLPRFSENCGCAHTLKEGRTTSPPFVRMCAQPQFSENRGSAYSLLRVCALPQVAGNSGSAHKQKKV